MAVTYANALIEHRRLMGQRPVCAIITPVSGGYDIIVKDSRQENENEAYLDDATVKPGTWKQYVIGLGAGESLNVFA